MPEYTYDPGADTGDVDFTHEQQAANTLSRANTRYNERQSNTYEPQASDLQLHTVLRQLDQETNPLVREQLEQKAMLLASGATIQEQRQPRRRSFSAPQMSDPDELNGSSSPMTTVYGQLTAELGGELDELLDYGRTQLDPDAAEVLNKSLVSDDIATARKGVEILRSMRENNLTSLPKS